MDFLPITSDQRPAGSKKTVLAMMYALMVHKPVMTGVCRSSMRCGSATTTARIGHWRS